MQAMHIEQLQDSIDSKAADAKEATADYEEKLVSLSAELGKAAQRNQQASAKLELIKQVQVSSSIFECPACACPEVKACEVYAQAVSLQVFSCFT